MHATPVEHALCDLISAVSGANLCGNVFVHLLDPSDRAAVAKAVDALLLLEPGQRASDGASWDVALLRLQVNSVVLPAWWPRADPGEITLREFLIDYRVQSVAIRAGTLARA
jgi:hypothetical protein